MICHVIFLWEWQPVDFLLHYIVIFVNAVVKTVISRVVLIPNLAMILAEK